MNEGRDNPHSTEASRRLLREIRPWLLWVGLALLWVGAIALIEGCA